MATGMKPIGRVLTGNDERGRSKVVWDGPAPQVHETRMSGRGHTDFWVWEKTPAPLSGDRDDGLLPDDFPGPGGGNEAYTSAMHKTESVDYGIMLTGERKIILDDAELTMQPGDIVIQVGAWHQWNSARLGCLMAFDMI